MHEAPARTSSKILGQRNLKDVSHAETFHRTFNRPCRNRNHKSSKSDSTVSTSDTNASRRLGQNRLVERLNHSKSGSDHSTPRARFEAHKKDKAFKVICPVEHRYEETIYFRAYHLTNTSSSYNDQVVQNVLKGAKRVQVQVTTSILDAFDPVLIIPFLSPFKLTCDTNGFLEGQPCAFFTASSSWKSKPPPH